MQRLRQLLEMIRFSHTVFALPFALLAAVMAWTAPVMGQWGESAELPFRLRHLLGIALCMVLARSAAMAFNRIADRRIDAQNPRTAGRHLPAGLVPLSSALWFLCGTCLAFVAATLLFLPNRLPLLLSLPVLAFLLAYSLTKRFTALAHFWLGTALMLAPVSAWLALRGEEVLGRPGDLLPALWLGAAVLLWVAGFDIIYACQDVNFDRAARLHSIPARLGAARSLRLAAACHCAMVGMLATLPWSESLGGPPLSLGLVYGCAVAAVGVLLLVEHWLVKPDDLTRVNIAFFHVNALLSIGLFVVTSVDLFVG
jgi:4-hydroxybenzoate polyprenyltransferase